MGTKTDIVDIALPEKVVGNKGLIGIAGFVNGSLEQVTENFENNNVFEGIKSGLDKLKKMFPKKNNNAKSVSGSKSGEEDLHNSIMKAVKKELSAFKKNNANDNLSDIVYDITSDRRYVKAFARAIAGYLRKINLSGDN